MYQNIKGPGYEMSTTAGTSSAEIRKTINFLYVPMGCMRDTEYADNVSYRIYTKGLVIEISGDTLTFTYYDNKGDVVNRNGYEPTAVYRLTSTGYVKRDF